MNERRSKSSHMFLTFTFALVLYFLVVKSIFSSVFFFFTNTEDKISFSDWPALDIDFSNTISAHTGGRKQSLLFQTCVLDISRSPR